MIEAPLSRSFFPSPAKLLDVHLNWADKKL